MTLTIIITKVQGEARKTDPSTGKLQASQHAKYQAVARGNGGHIVFRGFERNSAPNVRMQIDELIGPLNWCGGASDPEANNYGTAQINVEAL